jgi:hypothetical protein
MLLRSTMSSTACIDLYMHSRSDQSLTCLEMASHTLTEAWRVKSDEMSSPEPSCGTLLGSSDLRLLIHVGRSGTALDLQP